ncbi:MAG: hypothetical protein ACHQ9S_00070 [Candidatus Binatia bacterium]
MFWWRRQKTPGGQQSPLTPAVQPSAAPSARPVDYLEDEVASAFFDAREYEAYYRSLQRVEERRAFRDQVRQVLLRLLRLASEDGLRLIDDLITRTSEEAQREVRASFDGSPAQRVRRMEPEGMRLLGNDAGLDLKRLRAAYRAAALRCHPDRGGSHEQMTAVNRAYEQLHRILVEEGDYAAPWGSTQLSTTFAYLWAVRRLLFEIALDEWALDDAARYLGALASDKQRCSESQGQRLIDLIEPACKLTERLCAAGSVDGASVSLAVAQDGLRMAQACGLNYDWFVRQAAETVAGTHKPRFVLNDARQIENAFRLGAIDQKRYEANLGRVAGRKELNEADRSRRLALLAEVRFLPSLAVDARLEPSPTVGSLVPHPGYFEYRAEKLTSDQQAEYLSTFRDGTDLDLVAKYAFVRLSSLLRSAVFNVGRCDIPSLGAEAKLLAQLEPRCAWSAERVGEVIGFLAALSGGQRAAYAVALAKLLEPQPQTNGFIVMIIDTPIDLTETFFNSARELAGEYGAA